MDSEKSLPVRAFELAREGECASIKDLRTKLSREGYTNIDAHFDGISLKRQLIGLMRTSRSEVGI